MSTIELQKQMTVEEFLALPEDGVDRELINGVVREKAMTVRSESHSRAMASTARHLGNWVAEFTCTKFEVLCGEAGFILDEVDRLVVGVDVAVNHMDRKDDDDHSHTTLVCGAPHLAVEILSPSDTHKDVHEKIRLYLDHGVAAVWIVDPDDRTVRIYRRGQLPVFFNSDQTLACEPELPGFSVRVHDLFR